MSQAVKVLSVGEAQELGEKKTRLARVEVLTLDTKETMLVTCFLGKGNPEELKVGYDYEVDIKKGTPYKGKDQYSMPLWTMKEMPKLNPEKVEAEDEKAMWDQKEMRGHRRACLAIASGLIPEKDKESFASVDVIKSIAAELVAYVYNEAASEENIPF